METNKSRIFSSRSLRIMEIRKEAFISLFCGVYSMGQRKDAGKGRFPLPSSGQKNKLK